MSSETAAKRVQQGISAWIAKHLRLQVNQSKSGTGRVWERKFRMGAHPVMQEALSNRTLKRYRFKTPSDLAGQAPRVTNRRMRKTARPVV